MGISAPHSGDKNKDKTMRGRVIGGHENGNFHLHRSFSDRIQVSLKDFCSIESTTPYNVVSSTKSFRF